MSNIFISVGSNLGDRKENFRIAKKKLLFSEKISDFKTSFLYETNPVGGPKQGKYLNAVWNFKTSYSPQELLEYLSRIELKCCRERNVANGPRTLDLDILFYDNLIFAEENLRIPHPKLHERAFVLVPLCDFKDFIKHPILNKTVNELLDCLGEISGVDLVACNG